MNSTVRKILVWGGLAALVLLILSYAGGYLAGRIDARSPGTVSDNPLLWVALAVFVVVIMAGALWLTVVWMRAIDEAAREAHKAAWFWGGTIGMTVGFVLALMSVLPGAAALDLPGLWGNDDPAGYIAMGAILMSGIMALGYTVAWIAWWLRRR